MRDLTLPTIYRSERGVLYAAAKYTDELNADQAKTSIGVVIRPDRTSIPSA